MGLTGRDIMDLVAELRSAGEPYALATVVRTVSVTAAKAGAKAVIRADGAISDGWIGGGCARAAVLKAACEALADGQPRLVSVSPDACTARAGVGRSTTRAAAKGHRLPRHVERPARITLENNGKILPLPDGEKRFLRASGGGKGTGVEPSLGSLAKC